MNAWLSGKTHLKSLFAVLGFTMLLLPLTATAQTTGQNEKRQEIETILRDYLLKNPAIIKEALQALEAQEAAAAAEAKRKALRENRAALLQDAAGTTLGNPKGDVTIVTFLDYRCGYCKRVEATLQQLLKQDSGIRLVMKDIPILGPESLLAARVALAARAKGQYADLLHAFLTADELNAQSIDAIAARFGWAEASAKAAENKEIDQLLEANYALANRLSINGTPAIVIGDRLLEGAANLETLAALVAAERAKAPERNLSQKTQ